VKLLDGEKIEMELKPSKMAFIKHYSAAVLYLVSAYALWRLFNWPSFTSFASEIPISIGALYSIIFFALFALLGFLLSLEFISRIFLIANLLLAAFAIYLHTTVSMHPVLFFTLFSASCGILVFIAVTIYATTHTYYITNERIITKQSFISRRSREIFYEKISDISIEQSLLGRIFNFGSVIPVTQSGFGLGSSGTFAGAGAGAGKRGFFGVFGGGSKSTQEPRVRSYYQLFGVENPYAVKDLIVKHMHAHSPIPYLSSIEDKLERVS
jgi:hypothetical protein